MSLLSGIKFAPKERRAEPSEFKDRKEEKRSSDRKDSKDSKRKHEKHHRHHKSKKSHRDAADDRGRKFYESDSDSSVDLDKIAAEEEEKERHEIREQSLRRKPEPTQGEEGVKKFDPNHFRSLMDSLRRPVETAPPTSYNSSDEEAERERELEQKILREDTPRAPPSAAPVSAAPAAGATNQSAAAMLRDRLKQTRAHLTTPAVPVPGASTPGDDHPSHSSNVGVDRDLVALKNKYNQAQGDSASARQSQALGQRKRKANLPADQDADLDVHALKSRERAGGEDIDEVFRDNILRLGERYKGTEMGGKGAFGNGDKAGMDEEGEIDMKMFQRKEQSQADALQKEAQRAMKSQQQLRKVVESCRRCTESRTFLRAAVISAGENAVLRVKIDPDTLVEGHLEIVPVSHVPSILQCDEETQKEIERFQSCLRRMYETQGKAVLFIETAVHFHSRPHALIDVIPIERGMEDEASMFFKEAFFSCDEEWAQHKKIIDLSRARPLKRAVPTHFQYMAAEWGDPDGGSKDKGGMAPYGGIAHPVESEHTIDTNFCLDVVAGMLDLEPLRMRRAGNKGRPAGEATALGARVEKVVADFKAEWSAFDWTQYL